MTYDEFKKLDWLAKMGLPRETEALIRALPPEQQEFVAGHESERLFSQHVAKMTNLRINLSKKQMKALRNSPAQNAQ